MGEKTKNGGVTWDRRKKKEEEIEEFLFYVSGCLMSTSTTDKGLVGPLAAAGCGSGSTCGGWVRQRAK